MKTTTSTNQRKIVLNLDEIAHHSKYKNENNNINKPTKDSVELDEIAHHSKYKNENNNNNKPTKTSAELGGICPPYKA